MSEPLRPPRLTGNAEADLSGVVEFLWSWYRAIVLEREYVRNQEVGTSVQPADAQLTALAALAPTASDNLPYFTAGDAMALAALTEFARTLLDDASAATARGTLGLGALAVLDTVSAINLDPNSVTYDKIQTVPQDHLLGRATASTGNVEELSAATVKTLLSLDNVDNTSNATERAATATLTGKTLALGSNTVSGTKAQFNTACTDGDFAYVGAANAFSAVQTFSSGLDGVLGGTTPAAATVTTLAASGAMLLGTGTDNGVDAFQCNGSVAKAGTITAAGTTGNRTINKPVGRVNIAAGGTTITVTNSLVTANTLVFAAVQKADTTAQIKNIVPAAGSFIINMVAAVTAETPIAFQAINVI